MSNLIIIDITENEKIKIDESGNIKEIEGSGILTIKNPSNRSKLWELSCDLKENVNTTIESREIQLDTLNPTQEFNKNYLVQNLKYSSLIINELIDDDRERRSLKIEVSNPLEIPISDIKIYREVPSFLPDNDIKAPSAGVMGISMVNGVKTLEWNIISLNAGQTARLSIFVKKDINNEEKTSFGPLNITYSINNYKLTMLDPEIHSTTDTLTKINKKKGASQKLWDCEVEFVNSSEFQVKLENVKVVNKKKAEIETVFSHSPNKLLKPEQSWNHSFQIESEQTPELKCIIESFPLFATITRVIGEIEKESSFYPNLNSQI